MNARNFLFVFWLIVAVTSQVYGNITFVDIPLAEARQKALRENKFLFIDFYAPWCAPCKEMERDVFSVRAVAEYMNTLFISIRINGDEDAQAMNSYKVNAYPTMIMMDARGNELARHEGALNNTDFTALVHSVVNIKTFYEQYNTNKTPESVYNYLNALDWIHPRKAELIAKSYLNKLSEDKYTNPFHWQLIKRYARASDKALFSKVINTNKLYTSYPVDFINYVRTALDDLLTDALDLNRYGWLAQYIGYVQQYPQYVTSPDSLILVARVNYARSVNNEQFIPLLTQYMNTYLAYDEEARLAIGFDLVREYTKEKVLNYAVDLADEALAKQPNVNAYVLKALAYERMNKFKLAYANLLMAYNCSSLAEQETLNELEPRMRTNLDYNFYDGVNTQTALKKGNDGRYTLGAGKDRLMYGYPVPESTSHFIININGRLASNAPHLSGVHYLKATKHLQSGGAAERVLTSFEFEKVRVTQHLIPVDKEGKEVTTGLAQFYRVSYTFENLESTPKTIGLGTLVDTMMGDNDYCTISVNSRPVKVETSFSESRVPGTLTFYRTAGDTTDLMGTVLLRALQATPPDLVVVGSWPLLHKVKWSPRATGLPFGDSGYFLQWTDRNLQPKGQLEFTTYYGLPEHKSPKLQLIMMGDTYLTRTLTVYFDNQSDKLDTNAKMMLAALAEDETIDIKGVLLNGYADITGNSDYNFKLSQRRIESVGNVLRASNISFVPKPYGVEGAQNAWYNQQFGNMWDRKVEVVVYYKKKIKMVLN